MGGLQVGVVLLLSLAALCGLGLSVQAPAGRHPIFDSWWFAGVLLAIATNITAATVVRYPWPKRLTGFVITHAGLVLLLLGGAVSRLTAEEGQVVLSAGECADFVHLDEESLIVFTPGSGDETWESGDLKDALGKPARSTASGAATLEVLAMHPRVAAIEEWQRTDDPTQAPAIRATLRDGAGDQRKLWMRPGPGLRGRMDLGPIRIRTRRLRSEAAVAQFQRPEVLPDAPQIRLQLADGSDVDVPLANLTADPQVVGKSVAVSLAQPETPPGTLLVELSSNGISEQHIALPAELLAASAISTVSESNLRVRLVGAMHAPPSHVELGVADDGRTFLRAEVGTAAQRIDAGVAAPLPWPGVTLRIDEVIRHCVIRDTLVPLGPGQSARDVGRAAKIRVWSGGARTEGWVRFGESCRLGHAEVEWRWTHRPLGGAVQLLAYEVERYPGSERPAAYRSRLRIGTRDGATRDETVILNEPVTAHASWWPGRAWSLYQADGGIGEDGRPFSVLAARRDPGYPLFATGAAGVVLGIFVMFYVVPYRRRRGKGAPTG